MSGSQYGTAAAWGVVGAGMRGWWAWNDENIKPPADTNMNKGGS